MNENQRLIMLAGLVADAAEFAAQTANRVYSIMSQLAQPHPNEYVIAEADKYIREFPLLR